MHKKLNLRATMRTDCLVLCRPSASYLIFNAAA
jgi:hypothetical protein